MFVQPPTGSVLRMLLASAPAVYRLVDGVFKRALPPTPPTDRRVASCRVLDLLFDGEMAERLHSSSLHPLFNPKLVLANLPTSAVGMQPMAGWCDCDDEFANTPFSMRYLLHCLIAAGTVAPPDDAAARQIAQSLHAAEPRLVDFYLQGLFSAGTTLDGFVVAARSTARLLRLRAQLGECGIAATGGDLRRAAAAHTTPTRATPNATHHSGWTADGNAAALSCGGLCCRHPPPRVLMTFD